MTTRYVDVAFGGSRTAMARTLFQYDYGQVLRVTDLELPVAYEVHFANDKSGNSVTQIGNADGVAIPDSVLLTARSIYCWFYLHDDESDGETRYEVLIPVLQRAKPTNETPTPVQQDAITEAIAALNAAVEQTGADAQAATNAKDAAVIAQGKAEDAQGYAESAAGSAETDALKAEGFAVGEQNGEPVTSESPYYQNNAKYYATDAEYSAVAAMGISTAVRNDLDDIGEPEIITTQIAAKAQGTEDVPTGFTVVARKYIVNMGGSYPGNLSGSTDANNTFYMQAAEDMDVYVVIHGGSNNQICIFEDEPYGRDYRATDVFATNTAAYPFPTKDNPVHADAGQYITFSYNNGPNLTNIYWELYKVTKGDYHLKSTTPLTTTMNAEVDAKIKAETDSLNAMSGYQYLGGTWTRGDWESWDSTSSRTFRVRRREPIEFDREVILLSRDGFCFTGKFYPSGTMDGERTYYRLPANTPVKITVRRQIEDSSEEANISDFALQIVSATLISPINLYQPTFADVSMFERMGIGGDSYAAGGGIISGVTKLTWGKNLERQAGITVDIYAKSGVSVVGWSKSSTYGLGALLAGPECGLYWLQHGINGTSTPEEFGTSADMSADPQPDTFYGRYTYSVQQIQATFPDARIVLATITGSSYGLSQTTYKDVNTAIREIAAYCSVPCIEITDDDFFRSGFYSSWCKSNHPTAAVAAGMAAAYRRLISKCIQANKSYFQDFGS